MPEINSANITKEAPIGLSEGGTTQAYETFHVIPDQNVIITEDISTPNPTTFVTYTGIVTQDQKYFFAQEQVPTQQHTLMVLEGDSLMNQVTSVPVVNQVTSVPMEGDTLHDPMIFVRPAEDPSAVWELDGLDFVRYLGLDPPVETKSLDDNHILTDLLPSSSEPPSLASAVPSIFDDDLSTDCLPVVQEAQVNMLINEIVQDRANSNCGEPVPLPSEGGVISGGHPQEVTPAVSGGSAKGSKRVAPSRRSQLARKSSASSLLTPSTNSSSASSSSTRSRRRNKKSKAYERKEPFADMDAEKKRLNAINAKKNRDLKKSHYEKMKKDLDDAVSERNALLEDLKKMRQHEENLRTELEKKGIEFPCL